MKNIWSTKTTTRVHVELSSFCNAACPLCPRYYPGSTVIRAGLIPTQVTLDDFKKWFDHDFVKQVVFWKFCGTNGDPMLAKDVVKIIEYIYSVNPDSGIEINTNGGTRSTKDWELLGNISAEHNLTVIFSVDGLEDTNYLYRRNVKWNVLVQNMKTFISAGGTAWWDFLIFKHNEHQINDAMQFAQSLGFKKFDKKRANGFNNSNISVFGTDGEYDYTIDPPTDPDDRFYSGIIQSADKLNRLSFYKNNSSMLIKEFEDKVSSFHDKILPNNLTINCLSKLVNDQHEIYVSVDGIVYPCCYIGNSLNAFDVSLEGLQLHQRFKNYNKDNFDLNKNTLWQILEQHQLNRFASDHWESSTCLEICKNNCGAESTIVERYYGRSADLTK